jgi:hypothetical protein
MAGASSFLQFHLQLAWWVPKFAWELRTYSNAIQIVTRDERMWEYNQDAAKRHFMHKDETYLLSVADNEPLFATKHSRKRLVLKCDSPKGLMFIPLFILSKSLE